jgi:ABC-2 type transport system permease protein
VGSWIVTGFVVAAIVRATLAIALLTALAFALGMHVDGGPLDLVALYGLAALLNVTATLWATGVAMHGRSPNATPAAILPIFLLLFLTPVFLPLDLLHGWLHSVAAANPFTYILETGRSLIAGDPKDVGLAYAIAGGLVVATALWALWGVRRAEKAGS